jgi:penicillin-binding protein 2
LSFTREIQTKWRLNALTVFFALCFSIILVRLFQVQVVLGQEYEAKATSQQSRKFQIPASRGQIYLDENGELYPVALNQKLNKLLNSKQLNHTDYSKFESDSIQPSFSLEVV